MAIEIPRRLVEYILLGPEDDRRQLQDSPILGDVWFQFATKPDAKLELLITPYGEQPAGKLASRLAKYIKDGDIAYLQGIVAARLTFDQVLHYVVPLTNWWTEKRIDETIAKYMAAPGQFQKQIEQILTGYGKDPTPRDDAAMQDLETHKRYMALAGLMLWALDQKPGRRKSESLFTKSIADDVVKKVREFVQRYESDKPALHAATNGGAQPIWHVSLNRTATPAIAKSVSAVKADAARTLFTVNCKSLVWAVVDSGIDAAHPAFSDEDGKSRVTRAFDFTNIREIVSLDNEDEETLNTRISKLLKPSLAKRPTESEAREHLKAVAADAASGRSINWELVENLIEIKPETRPPSNHGTHVAGIIAANKGKPQATEDEAADGMCPEIRLYDFRVLAPTLMETEFAIIAALQYIRYINERNSYMTIHGANLSLSIKHDVRNYACGRTPVCNECERLVNSGVVVVAAAGNRGYQNFETKDGLYEGYAAFSVTDPGNADGVITVGATHRFWPHTYGVSFFSSRGPTGDGRLKPDIVAPGERIRAPLRDKEWGDLDGTSMAAPHVSGAAAMLMARYSELVGQPRRIKQILCDSATDLGRERSFQGRGMLDVLRAFQSI